MGIKLCDSSPKEDRNFFCRFPYWKGHNKFIFDAHKPF